MNRAYTKGFTLVETVIAMAVTAFILVAMTQLILGVLQGNEKTKAITEVTAAGRVIHDRLTHAARHAEGVINGSSVFSVDPGVIAFDMVDAAVDPTIFSLSADDGTFQIREAGGADIPLTDHVRVTALTFSNVSTVNDAGIIQVTYTIETMIQNATHPYAWSQTFQTALRIPLTN